MASDVSGNDHLQENEDFQEVENEQVEQEQSFDSSVDYTSYFENLQNDIRFTNVILLAFLLLFALLKGLKKL